MQRSEKEDEDPSVCLTLLRGVAENDRVGDAARWVSSEKEEEDRRRRLQLYVFVMRCIAYPFNAKQPTDMARRQVKVVRAQLTAIRERFQVDSCTHSPRS